MNLIVSVSGHPWIINEMTWFISRFILKPYRRQPPGSLDQKNTCYDIYFRKNGIPTLIKIDPNSDLKLGIYFK